MPKTLKYAVVGESIGIMRLFDTRKEAEAWAAEIIDGYGEIYIREVKTNVRKN